jgi:hypothetical protein
MRGASCAAWTCGQQLRACACACVCVCVCVRVWVSGWEWVWEGVGGCGLVRVEGVGAHANARVWRDGGGGTLTESLAGVFHPRYLGLGGRHRPPACYRRGRKRMVRVRQRCE